MRRALQIDRGPWLLRSPHPDLATHLDTHGSLPRLDLDALLEVVDSALVRGRGGAGFPFARKLRTTATRRGRRHVVVNLSEGEPLSSKDLALALAQPHLVLDGASVTAQALRVRTVHLVLPGEHPDARVAMERAIAERRDQDRAAKVGWELHLAAPRFVSGESSAVTELIHGRSGLPVTSWEPTAVAGVHGRPTLLSNAETFAHVAAVVLRGGSEYAALGTPDEPGTTLLTLASDSGTARVVETPYGAAWSDLLSAEELAGPVLLGGYHGTWALPGALEGLPVSRIAAERIDLTIGAGVVLPLPSGSCPLERTAHIVDYLAGQSARRCGPCFNGLPALATAFEQAVAGRAGPDIDLLMGFLDGRGACAHPDGSVRLVRSAMRTFRDDLLEHARGGCLMVNDAAQAV